MKLKIKYFDPDMSKLKFIDGGDWIDLRSSADIDMKQGEYKLIPLGVAMQIPIGYEAHIAPRSSTFKNFGIIMTNHVGVVDGSYCGDNDQWYFSAYALRDTSIHWDDRICQFRIIEKQPRIEIEEVLTLGNPDRSGFGSTGIK